MGVGKTSIVARMKHDQFQTQCESTVGCAFHRFKIGDKKFEVWDTAGQERFMSIGPMYYRNARILIFVFALDDRKTFDQMLEFVDYFFAKVGNDGGSVNFMIVGNKADLDHEDEALIVTRCQTDPRILGHGLGEIRPLCVSAKDGTGINQIITQMLRHVTIEEMAEKPLPLEAPPVPSDSYCSC
jgi:Ras-related protein Rab-5C